MILIVGLGNPGEQYKYTRHNTGFTVLDELAKAIGFDDFQLNKDWKSLTTKGVINEKDVILIKPQTFMNESGKSVKKIVSYFKIKPGNIYVVHDEADLPLGTFKIKEGGTSAGHKGVQSIIDELGTKDFFRFRVGIESEDPSFRIPIEKREGLESVVLKNFSAEEITPLSEAIKQTVNAIISKIKEAN
ncbi:MAG: aminoacyl-tRNA hydrolase [Candidatus Paceibacterota bacterium]